MDCLRNNVVAVHGHFEFHHGWGSFAHCDEAGTISPSPALTEGEVTGERQFTATKRTRERRAQEVSTTGMSLGIKSGGGAYKEGVFKALRTNKLGSGGAT